MTRSRKAAILRAKTKPTVLEVDPAGIPDDLKALDRWVLWRLTWKDDKQSWDKVPADLDGRNTDATDPQNWHTFAAVLAAYQAGKCDGIGFVLGDADGRILAGLDLDDCRDPETGKLTADAQRDIATLATYTEISPSGTGTKSICTITERPGPRVSNKGGRRELYSGGRYFAITGQRVDGTPQRVEDRREQFAAIYKDEFGKPKRTRKTLSTSAAAGVHAAALAEMKTIEPKAQENDGSSRLVTLAIIAVKFDLSKSQTFATIREYEKTYPLPRTYTEDEIWRRVEKVEERGEYTRGESATPSFAEFVKRGNPVTNGVRFATADAFNQAATAVLRLPHYVDVPASGRPITAKRTPEGIRLKMKRDRNDPDQTEWERSRDEWTRDVHVMLKENVPDEKPAKNLDDFPIDDHIRVVRDERNRKVGQAIRDESERWIWLDRTATADNLVAEGMTDTQARQTIGTAISRSWLLANQPFAPIEPGDRKWNPDGAQRKIEPADTRGKTKTWSAILSHVGRSLDDAVAKDEWCREHCVLSGAVYLFLWLASLLQRPGQKLPALFFWGGQNRGKSAFVESIDKFLITGVHEASSALTSAFNGELDGCALAYISETDVSRPGAYERLKSHITDHKFAVHGKGRQVYQARNWTHWVLTANDPAYVPVGGDDTRIVVSEVPPLGDSRIRADVFDQQLEAEAPYFLRKLLTVQLPPPCGEDSRLYLPVLNTQSKAHAVEANLGDDMLDFAERLADLAPTKKPQTANELAAAIAYPKSPRSLAKLLTQSLREPLQSRDVEVTVHPPARKNGPATYSLEACA